MVTTMSLIPHSLLTSDCDSLLKGKWGLCPLTLSEGRLEAMAVATLWILRAYLKMHVALLGSRVTRLRASPEQTGCGEETKSSWP